jgi:DNA mismatch repair protein MutS
VTARAAVLLERLEHQARLAPRNLVQDLPLFQDLAIAEQADDPLDEALAALDPDELSPKEALEMLYRLKLLWGERGERP